MQSETRQEWIDQGDDFSQASPELDFYINSYHYTVKQADGTTKSFFGRSYVQFNDNKATPASINELEKLLCAKFGADTFVTISLSKL